MTAVDLAGKRVLITGGAGFIGSQIAEIVAGAGAAEVVSVDDYVRGRPENLEAARRLGPVTLVEGDIRDRALMMRLVAGADVVFHMAALRITHCAAEPRLAFEVMGEATFQLLELCVSRGIEKVVAASSASIYGLADRFPTPESANPYDNRTLYGALKMFNEGLLRSFADMYGLRYAAMRYFNVYGPRMDIHGKYTEVLIRWMERIARGEPPVIFGDGLQTMDFVHVHDVARATVAAMTADVHDLAFNVARGEETSLRGLAEALLKVMGRPDLAIEYGPERAVNPVPRRLADTSLARDRLDFTARIGLEEGLAGLVDWWRAERAGPATSCERIAS